MSFCDRCGSLYKVEEASGAAAIAVMDQARCTGCNRCENVRAAFDKGRHGELQHLSDTFLFKYGIEPMNPDGSKFGAVKDVTRERAVVMRRPQVLAQGSILHHAAVAIGR